MINILLSGCNGTMGKVITSHVESFDDCQIVCGVDVNLEINKKYPVYDDTQNIQEKVDVIIDFSHPAALNTILDYALKKKIPAVIATTGLSQEQIAQIDNASKHIPIFFSANMSIGVNLVSELAQKAATILNGQFDIEIVEAHHNQKIDAPSGTALMLADAISEKFDTPPRYEFDRHSKRMKRSQNEIGIHSVRGGTIVGEHEIIFAGNDEVIKITHTAMSKHIFANGSINAARFLYKQPIGKYSMKEMLNK